MPETSFKDLTDQIQQNWGLMKTHMDEQQTEIKKFGTESAETKQMVEAYNSKITDLEGQIKELRAAANRPMVAGTEGSGRSAKDRLEAEARRKYDLFFRVLHRGILELNDGERKEFRERYAKRDASDADDRQTSTMQIELDGKALSLGDDTASGYLAPPEFVQDILKGVQLISPIRPLAQVRQTARRSVQYPVRSGVFAAKWTAETGTRTETAGLTYALEEVPNHEMYALVFVSDQDLEDAVFNLEQEILDNCSEQFAKAEGAAFVNGSAVGQPEGLLTNTNVASDASTFVASHALNPNALIATWGNLKTVYARNATWLMNRQTIAACRALVDGQGRYLWEPGLSDGTPPNLLGSPYMEIPDMPNLPSSAGSATAIMYGNVKRAYLIVDRISVSVRRLQEKYAESGQIAYLVRKRVGGQVVLPEAVRKMNVTYA